MVKFEITITKKHLYAALGVLLALVVLVPAGVWAAGRFTDVPDSNIFQADIEWLADAGVTKGCNPGEGNTEFCPKDEVTREQMAAFMNRLANNRVVDAGTLQGLSPADLQGQQGPKGDKGDPGPKGDKGDPADLGTLATYKESQTVPSLSGPDGPGILVCDPGDLALHGGYDVDLGVEVIQTRAGRESVGAPYDRWLFTTWNSGTLSGTFELLCLDLPPLRP